MSIKPKLRNGWSTIEFVTAVPFYVALIFILFYIHRYSLLSIRLDNAVYENALYMVNKLGQDNISDTKCEQILSELLSDSFNDASVNCEIDGRLLIVEAKLSKNMDLPYLNSLSKNISTKSVLFIR